MAAHRPVVIEEVMKVWGEDIGEVDTVQNILPRGSDFPSASVWIGTNGPWGQQCSGSGCLVALEAGRRL